MVRNILYCLALLLFTSSGVHAQDGYTERAKKYVDKYYPLAIAEQRASGIPASVTLGQGILETEAGTSELMIMANNHFGIKCKNNWQGPTFLHTDDAKDECFKKYTTAEESYRDHSAHLINNPRYAPLFKCSKTDYAAWAVGLKRCGYATNPQYAQRLIKIIEDFRLQEFTYAALDSYMLHNYPALVDEAPDQVFKGGNPLVKKEYVKDTGAAKKAAQDSLAKTAVNATAADTARQLTPAADTAAIAVVDPIRRMADSLSDAIRHQEEQELLNFGTASDTSKIVIVNGLKAFAARKDDMLLEYAVKYKIRYPHLLEMNDLPDAPLPFDMYVYLEKKLTSGTHDKHTVKPGENLLMIAQAEGMQLKRLTALNFLMPGEEPMPGAVLELQTAPGKKPLLSLNPFKNHKTGVQGKDSATVADSNAMASYKAPVYSSLSDGTDSSTKPAPPPPGRHDVEPGSGGISNTDTAAMRKNNYIAIEKSKPAAGTTTDNKPSDKKPETSLSTSGTRPKFSKDTATAEELARLKARLDQSVYADAPKATPFKDDPQQPQLPKPATEKEYKKGDKFYIVKRGDTAYSIAKRNEITVAQLLKWNDTEPQDIKAGQTLRVKE